MTDALDNARKTSGASAAEGREPAYYSVFMTFIRLRRRVSVGDFRGSRSWVRGRRHEKVGS